MSKNLMPLFLFSSTSEEKNQPASIKNDETASGCVGAGGGIVSHFMFFITKYIYAIHFLFAQSKRKVPEKRLGHLADPLDWHKHRISFCKNNWFA